MKKIVFVVLMVFALSAVYDTPFAAENSEYSKALKYYNSKNSKRLLSFLKEQVQKNPTPSAYYLLGYSLYKNSENLKRRMNTLKRHTCLTLSFRLRKPG